MNIIKDGNNWKISHKFEKDGIYKFEIVFNDDITNLEKFFENCRNIISLDFSFLNTSDVVNMEIYFLDALN